MKELIQWFKKRTHTHQFKTKQQWCMVDGNLAVHRVYECTSCGYKEPPTLLRIATPEELAEAQTRVITNNTNGE